MAGKRGKRSTESVLRSRESRERARGAVGTTEEVLMSYQIRIAKAHTDRMVEQKRKRNRVPIKIPEVEGASEILQEQAQAISAIAKRMDAVEANLQKEQAIAASANLQKEQAIAASAIAEQKSKTTLYCNEALLNSDSPTPKIELVIGHRVSSASHTSYAAATAKGQQENQVLANRLLLRHPNQPIVYIHGVSRVRQSRDPLYEDCGPNAGRVCPVEGDQHLFDVLDACHARGNIAVLFERGADCLTNPPSLQSWIGF